MGTVKSMYNKLIDRQKKLESELENLKDFLRTIELKLKTSNNHTKTIMGLLDAMETYRYDGIEEANYEALTI